MPAELPYPETDVENRPLSRHTVEDIPVLLAVVGSGRRIGAQDCSHTPLQEPYVRLSVHTARAFHYPVMGGTKRNPSHIAFAVRVCSLLTVPCQYASHLAVSLNDILSRVYLPSLL